MLKKCFINSLCYLVLLLPLQMNGQKDSSNQQIMYPGRFIGLGLTNRTAAQDEDYFKIQYYNQGPWRNDTFRFADQLTYGQQLVNFTLSGGICNKWGGLKADLGFVPFANRNSNMALSAFALIPVTKKIFITPLAGVSRFRKMRKIGTLEGVGGRITFQGVEFNELSLRAAEAWQSYNYGGGIMFNLNDQCYLNIEVRRMQLVRSRYWVNVRGYKDDADKTLLESLAIADKSANFEQGDKEVLFRDVFGNVPQHLYKINRMSFTVQLIIRLSEPGGGN